MTVVPMSRRRGRTSITPARDSDAARLEAASWVDKFLPWTISVTFHLGLALVAAFVIYAAKQQIEKERVAIIVPNAFEDPAYSEHPGGNPNPGADDPMSLAAQDRLKQAFKSEGWSQSAGIQDVSSLLGSSGPNEALGIFNGSGATLGMGRDGNADSGTIMAFGPAGGAGNGPRSSFYGTGGNATKIVYIIDTSGSMIGSFDYVKRELKRSINSLVPVQFFNVVTVGTTEGPSRTLGPFGQLLRATPENKKLIVDKFADLVPQGPNDGILQPFASAFQQALSTKPELIYFLCDGKNDPALVDYVTKLNKDKGTIINAMSYEDLVEEEARRGPLSDAQLAAEIENTLRLDRIRVLEDLATQNGGRGKLVFELTNRSLSVDIKGKDK